MATLAQLKTRIILQTNRDDMGSGGLLEQELTDAITDSIEEHADELFWFNRTTGTKDTVAATATVAVPSGMRLAKAVSYDGAELVHINLEQIQYRTETGRPTHWAENEGAIQLWPIPDAVYTLSVYGIAELGVPASGASNEWTTTALELTLAATKKRLYRDTFRDPEGAAMSKLQEDDALAHLRRETRRRNQQALQTDIPPTRNHFNIMTG